MADLLTIDEALERVLQHVRLLGAEGVATNDGLGRIVREPARAIAMRSRFVVSDRSAIDRMR